MATPNPKEVPVAPWFWAAGKPGTPFPRANPAGWTWLEDTPHEGPRPKILKAKFGRVAGQGRRWRRFSFVMVGQLSQFLKALYC